MILWGTLAETGLSGYALTAMQGETIDYEDVVAGLTEDVVSYSAHLGVCVCVCVCAS
jgi:ribose 5-phosphate isomerase RpiB